MKKDLYLKLDQQVYKRRPADQKFDTIYNGFDYTKYEVNTKCAGAYREEYWSKLFDEIKPSLIIELGAYLGFSSILMSQLCEKYHDDFRIFTVDTWTVNWHYGDVLKWKHGYPTIYYQYIANIHYHGFEKNIYPIPLPTSVAVDNPIKESLDDLNLQVDMVYVDAGHDFFSVYSDMENYYKLIRPGGVMFGDDFTGSPGVAMAVKEFCRVNDLQYTHDDINWRINKK